MAPESSQIIAERPTPLQARMAKSACKIPLTPFPKGGREGDFRPAGPDTPTLVTQTEGFVAGMIQYIPEGDDGFGYDPVFYLPPYEKTVAQLPLDVKNQISHRANAAQKAADTLKKLIADS